MKKTKIVCTIGPASENPEVLEQLIKAGMNVMRLNFSHGDHEEHLAKVKTLRALNEKLGTNVAFMLDTKGPEIRTGSFGTDPNIKMNFEIGDKITLYYDLLTPESVSDVRTGYIAYLAAILGVILVVKSGPKFIKIISFTNSLNS